MLGWSGDDGSLHLECGAGGELLRFDERPGVVLHPKQLLGVPFGSPAAQAYAAGHPATKLVQRQGVSQAYIAVVLPSRS